MQLIAESGELVGLIFDLKNKNEFLIGRDPDLVDFVLNDQTVSRKHCLIYKKGKNFFIKNLSKVNPIEVNDEKVFDDYQLIESDKIQIGHTVFILSEGQESLETPKEITNADEGFDDVFEDLPEDEVEEIKEKILPKQVKEEKTAFDTIFEDIENEEEVSYDLGSDSNFILKVITGPNAGAEFGMVLNKSYLIGKDSSICDIVFNDLSVSKKHAEIEIDADGNISIKDLDSKNHTYINSHEISKPTKISSKDLISLGTTTFLVVDKKESLETIYSPFPLAGEKVLEKEEEELKDAVIGQTREKTSWREQIIPTKHLVYAGSFILIMFIMVMSFFSLFKSQKIDVKYKSPDTNIKKILKNYDDVNFSFNPAAGNIFLVGHVLTSINHEELLYDINQLPFIEKVEDNTIIDELVWKNFNNILTENESWRGITIYSPKAGKFILTGYIKTSKEAENLQDYININFPFLDKLENHVAIENVLNYQIESMLISEGMSALTYEVINGELVLTGYYDQKRKKDFTTLLNHLKTINGIRDIKNLALASNKDSSMVDISNKYQITGYASHNAQNVNVIANGQIVSIGDLLDGMSISNISKNTIVLEKDGINYKINYNR